MTTKTTPDDFSLLCDDEGGCTCVVPYFSDENERRAVEEMACSYAGIEDLTDEEYIVIKENLTGLKLRQIVSEDVAELLGCDIGWWIENGDGPVMICGYWLESIDTLYALDDQRYEKEIEELVHAPEESSK